MLGAAGLSLSLASGASAAATGISGNLPAPTASVSQQMTLRDEEISDVSLATFHVFDKESNVGQQLVCGCGGGCCLFARAPSPVSRTEAYSLQAPHPIGPAHRHGRKNP